MKNRTIFLTLFGIFAAFQLSAQIVSVGVRGGYSLADFIVDEKGLIVDGIENYEVDENYRALHGFHVGIDVRTAWGPRWAVLTGIQYHQKGSRQPVYFPTGPSEGKYITSYVAAPLLAEFRIWKGLSVQAGAEAGYLVNSVLKAGGEKVDLDDFGIYNSYDLGLAAGLEYRAERGFFAGVRQTWGIINAYDETLFVNEYGSTQEVKGYNRALEVSFGYRYTW